MAFQEPADPFVEKLQFLIDDLRQGIQQKEFQDILEKIDEQFPFVNLLEFLEMFVDGEYSKVLIEKFHLLGYVDYYKLLQILKINKKRKAARKNSISRKINLSDKKLRKRYAFLQKTLSYFENSIKEKIDQNVLRAIIILQLYSSGENFSSKDGIIEKIPISIEHFEHLVFTPHTPLSTISKEKITKYANSILQELQDNLFLETNNSDQVRLTRHQLLIKEYVFNTVQNRIEGITYQQLLASLKEKLPILSQIPPALIDITLHELLASSQVIKKEGYWKFKPFFDQYFTFENYRKLNSDANYSIRRYREFFGRKITPGQFIKELADLERGSFEDQDDQVTRIAGMILANSNMMRHPPNELKEFDFAVDLSQYEFTKKQQETIKNLNLEIRSNIVYVKVMINEKINISDVSDFILKLNDRGRNEQAFLISFLSPDELVQKMLEKNKTVQIISERELMEWCKITPVIPSRRGAVAVIRQGDNKGSIVKIRSVNYESGRADVVLLPDMREGTSYIGSLEEITIPVSMKKFTDYSSIYFQFLAKLRQISKTDMFRKIVSDGLFVFSYFNQAPTINILSHENEVQCTFGENFKTRINFSAEPDFDSLAYTITDLFSCTCFQWNEKSRRNGLCEHLIFTLNEYVKEILSLDGKMSEKKIQWYLRQIEKRMDLFLNRLRYSNFDDAAMAKCPNCEQVAYSLRGVEDTFGFRQMKRDDKFSLRRQSQCKICRRQS